jgi:hypothetical protein
MEAMSKENNLSEVEENFVIAQQRLIALTKDLSDFAKGVDKDSKAA